MYLTGSGGLVVRTGCLCSGPSCGVLGVEQVDGGIGFGVLLGHVVANGAAVSALVSQGEFYRANRGACLKVVVCVSFYILVGTLFSVGADVMDYATTGMIVAVFRGVDSVVETCLFPVCRPLHYLSTGGRLCRLLQPRPDFWRECSAGVAQLMDLSHQNAGFLVVEPAVWGASELALE